jgi:hypothetical protein
MEITLKTAILWLCFCFFVIGGGRRWARITILAGDVVIPQRMQIIIIVNCERESAELLGKDFLPLRSDILWLDSKTKL